MKTKKNNKSNKIIIFIGKKGKRRYKGGDIERDAFLAEIFEGLSDREDFEEFKEYLKKVNESEEQKASLIDFINKKIYNKEYDKLRELLNKKNRDQLVNSEEFEKLKELIKQKSDANETLTTLIEQIKKLKIDEKFKKNMIDAIERENGMKAMAISKSALNLLKKGSMGVFNFFAPTPSPSLDDTDPNKMWNETRIDLLWYPRANLNYKKGKSNATEGDKIKYGDFAFVIQPEKYTSTREYLSQLSGSVEDLLANVLNGCNNFLCKDGVVKREPYKHKTLKIRNRQPWFDKKNIEGKKKI